MSVLVIAPHPDDEAIGCGGAILGHVARGDAVRVIFLTSGELGLPQLAPDEARAIREAEAEAAARVLGLADLRFLRLPDWNLAGSAATASAHVSAALADGTQLVYAPHPTEWHPDHRAAHEITLSATRSAGIPLSSVLGYEVWTPMSRFDDVEDISDRLDRKLDAIRCHASQLGEFDYIRASTGLAQYRGALAARTSFAEVFVRCG